MTTIQVETTSAGPASHLAIEPRTRADDPAGAHGYALGDPVLDEAMVIHGDEATVRALFGAEFRTLARAWTVEGGTLLRGTLLQRVPGFPTSEAQIETLQRLVDMATAIAAEPGIDAIVHHALEDPLPGVRRACFRFALKHHRTTGPVAHMLDAGRTSPWADVRMMTAAAFVSRGEAILEEIADDDTVDDALRERAFSRLVDLESPLLIGVAQRFAASGRASRCNAVFEAASRLGWPAFAPIVRAVLTGSDRFDRSLAFAALRATGDVTDEPTLLNALSTDDEQAVAAAIAALGALGTLAAVEPLMAIADTRRGDSDLRRAAERAIHDIQARCGRDAPGGLALVQGDGGLAVTDEA